MYFFIGSGFSDRVPQNVKLRLNLGKAQIRMSPARVIEGRNRTHVYEVPPRNDHHGVDLISDVANSMRSQRSPLERAAQGKSIEKGNCGKPADQSDNDYNFSKTEHPAREHSKSGTHCYLRQGTESQSYKQIDPNPFFQLIDFRCLANSRP
jgi:hypothetical protein